MRFFLSLCVVALLLPGCRKKSSPEFYKLEGAQEVLIAQQGDDAYVAPEMASIIAALSAVPDDALEKPRAQQLVAKLVAGTARVKAERVEPPKLPAVDPFAGRLTPYQAPVEAPPAPEVIDAGEPEPWAGMDEATFAKRYGSCFSKGPKTEVGRGVPATSQVLAPSAECQKRLGTPGGTTSYLFVDGGVWGKVVETYAVLDAGPRAQPPPPPPPAPPRDAGEPILTIPGAPLPEGYQKNTVY